MRMFVFLKRDGFLLIPKVDHVKSTDNCYHGAVSIPQQTNMFLGLMLLWHLLCCFFGTETWEDKNLQLFPTVSSETHQYSCFY